MPITSLWSVWDGTQEVVFTGTILAPNGVEWTYTVYRNKVAMCGTDTYSDLDIYCAPGLFPGELSFTDSTTYPSVRTPLRPSDTSYPLDYKYPEDS